MPTKNQIGIIGGGALGGALGQRLASPQVKISCWDVNPKLRTASSLDELCSISEIILICTPSQTNRVIAREVAQVIDTGPGPAVISLAKGIEPGFITMDAVLKAELGDRFKTGIISGPMLAAEIRAGHTAGATVATDDPELTTQLASHLGRAGFIVETSNDTTGVARAGVFKNIFALGFGLCDGLELGYNFKSLLTVKAIGEFQGLLNHFGSDPSLALGMAGLGDLMTTGWSGLSFNWRVGSKWASGVREPAGEGINTLRELVKLMSTQKYPVVHALECIFLRNEEPAMLVSVISGNTSK